MCHRLGSLRSKFWDDYQAGSLLGSVLGIDSLEKRREESGTEQRDRWSFDSVSVENTNEMTLWSHLELEKRTGPLVPLVLSSCWMQRGAKQLSLTKVILQSGMVIECFLSAALLIAGRIIPSFLKGEGTSLHHPQMSVCSHSCEHLWNICKNI